MPPVRLREHGLKCLDRLLAHPRLLQLLAVALGIVLIGWTLRWPGQATLPDRSLPVATPTALPDDPLVAAVMAYNQASITAGLLGSTEPLAPLVDPQGSTWQQIRDEFDRRAVRRETRSATLRRWSVLSTRCTGDYAEVETTEEWESRTRIDGTVVSGSIRTTTHHRYTLRYHTGRWLIESVWSQVLIG